MKHFYLLLMVLIFMGCKNNNQQKNEQQISEPVQEKTTTDEEANNTSTESSVKIHPINHASFVLELDENVIYVDPVQPESAYRNYKKPTIVLVTDIHKDHFSVETLLQLSQNELKIIMPKAVYMQLPEELKPKAQILNNDEEIMLGDINYRAIPMYNLREEALQYHPKGRGNGYLLSWKNEKIYISGDTEDIIEMRNLTNITRAFICMNLPYTMPVEKAADAVLDFQPKKVYPYHFRGTNGLSDVAKFKNIVTTNNNNIEVIKLSWY
ncbi:MBL fold metallo-hydrolase [Mesonia sp. K7]|uniref:MBL fold metallo-hydrolase n=1 Tax=Mesonia sp. K7 TaxID=2218606 RepID=UPI000DA723AD|nr:MBL fold metallo-hydrolase [Mesonia sp. K7]PZD79374.1 MBL fold metallo-hydrolase [Mesonia sp. K7]